MKNVIESDYLVIGAGGMGMAFADEILTHTDASITIVDKHHRPGGHWNDAYPFVRLHQASVCYGVNSTQLGDNSVDQVGLNKGCYELASGSEVVAYFDNVMRKRFLPSGRVEYLPLCEYRGDGKAVSRACGTEYEIRAKKIVDASYLNVTVPSQRPPKFDVTDGARCVPPNDLPRVVPEHDNYVIVGSGKTGMDACLFLLSHGVDPDKITWIMPSDAWMFDRFSVNPGRGFDDPIAKQVIGIMQCALQAESYDSFFELLVRDGLVLQLDSSVTPTRWRCATFTPLEIEQLHRIKNIVRLGYVNAVSPTEIALQQGTHPAPQNAVFVDCAADGLPKVPATDVFQGNKITLQTVRMCQQVYSAAFIANVEANVDADEHRKNELCQPVPQPYLAEDYIRCAIQNSENMLVWLTEPAVVSWINASRIDLFSPYLDFEDPETRANIEQMGELLQQAVPKMKELLQEHEEAFAAALA